MVSSCNQSCNHRHCWSAQAHAYCVTYHYAQEISNPSILWCATRVPNRAGVCARLLAVRLGRATIGRVTWELMGGHGRVVGGGFCEL